jgi:cell wall-associated NlpC family hydrolase
VTAPAPRKASIAVLAALAALAAATPASAEPQIAAKQAEAERIFGEIRAIDADLEHVIDAYNAAQERLAEIQAEQRRNKRRLVIARSNYAKAQAALQGRLVALYQAGEANVVEVLLGATSFTQVVDRVEAVTRVSEEDARIAREVRAFRAEIRRREHELARARAEQAQVVAERAARRRLIERQLAERQRLLAQVKDEIARLEAAEAERQRRLEEQARERLQGQAAAGTAAAPSGTTAAPSSPDVGAAPPARYGGVVGIAMRYLGTPYRWGGASPSTGFDCSGFVMYVFAQVGVSLPHNAAAQYSYGSPVSRSQLQPGDLVFFNGLGHNGIYIGGGQFIHSPHTGDVVKISSLGESWYASTYVGARRL